MEKATKEVWIYIFEFLESKDLEKAAKVCKNWKDFITSTSSLRRKLNLEIDFSHELNMEKCLKLPYCNLNMKSVSYSHWTQVNYPHEFNENPTRVQNFVKGIDCDKVEKIYVGINSQLPLFNMILKDFHNLKTLSSESLYYTVFAGTTRFDMPKLKYLKTSTFCWLSCLPLKNLKILHLMNYKNFVSISPTEDRLYSGEAQSFEEFIKKCENLKHLILTRFYTRKISNFKGRLVTLEIVGVHSLPSDFKNFLKSQKNSLKNLTLDVLKFDDEISNFIYFEMNLVKILDSRERHGGIRVLKPINSLKNLTIRIKSQEKEEFLYFKNLFSCCNSLEVLDINLPKSKEILILLMIAKLPNLKHLKLSHVEENGPIDLPITKMEKIHKLTFYGQFGFNAMSIVSLCSNVKTVEVFDREKFVKPGSEIKPKLEICENSFIEITKNFNDKIGFVKLSEKSFDVLSVTEKNLWMLDEVVGEDFMDSDEFDNHEIDIKAIYNFGNDEDDSD